MKASKQLQGVLAALTLTATSTQAVSLALINPSFEDSTLTGGWNGTTPNGWTLASGSCGEEWDGGVNVDGNIFCYLQESAGNPSIIGQEITTLLPVSGTLAVGDVIDLSFIARNQNAAPTVFWDIVDAPSAVANSLIGGTRYVSISDWSNPLFDSVTITSAYSGNAYFAIGTDGAQARVDKIGLDITQVPEPSTIALVSLAWLALLPRRRRK
ncbi:MAG: PEP-CTERM sorting domain-containing protein [Akkermansiaceae bacterium]|nr:PEP-CTERM sorting domain-containing protein [Akkermansiaceae bacterium]